MPSVIWQAPSFSNNGNEISSITQNGVWVGTNIRSIHDNHFFSKHSQKIHSEHHRNLTENPLESPEKISLNYWPLCKESE